MARSDSDAPTLTPPPAAGPAAVRPVARRSLVDEVVEALSLPILRGELEPGTTLPPERTLAEQLGVRRGTLREGVQRLQQAGLVEVRHGGGTFVGDWRRTAGLEVLPSLIQGSNGSIDGRVVLAVIEMRSALAPDVARQAARRRTDAQAARLRALVEGLTDPGHEAEQRAVLVSELWSEIVDASGNVAYRLAYNALLRTADLGQQWVSGVLAGEREQTAEYAELVEAIASGDTDLAGRRAHDITRQGQLAFEQALARDMETAS
jgi:DNA-binding FadR family transcriptional regulator